MINFSDEIDNLTTAQAMFVLGWLVNAVETEGQATAQDVREAIEQAVKA